MERTKDLALVDVESMTDLELLQYAKDAKLEIINLRCQVHYQRLVCLIFHGVDNGH